MPANAGETTDKVVTRINPTPTPILLMQPTSCALPYQNRHFDANGKSDLFGSG